MTRMTRMASMTRMTPMAPMATRCGGVLLTALVVGACTVAGERPAVAAQCAAPAGVYRDPVGWATRLVDPARIWPLTTGAGQVVAVVGTGVDAGNAQLAGGQLLPGPDNQDCDGRGTFAAGIVAARPDPSTTFSGIAPGARVLALRAAESTTEGPAEGEPDAVAGAITRAADSGASVILVVTPTRRSSPALEAAVRHALARNSVVVSSVVGDKPDARSYPAALPGVVAVTGIDQSGTPVPAESGDHVSIAAPGKDLAGTSAGAGGRIGHRWGVADPALSAASVAATVALLRAYRPGLTPSQVVTRLTATAVRPPQGVRDSRLGWGVLNAYAAVAAEGLDGPAPSAGPSERAGTVAPAAGPPSLPPQPRLPGALALLAVVVAALAAPVALLVRRGRARRWRA
ncbi:S8 family serine peptidase [Streptoalloteichus tenebrarius]